MDSSDRQPAPEPVSPPPDLTPTSSLRRGDGGTARRSLLGVGDASRQSEVPPPAGEAERLPRAFYARPTLEVAPDLLGLWLVHDGPAGRQAGRIVEVEAYVGTDDLASHASRGRTARTCVMFGPAGHVYVFLIYGMHHCFNVVTDRDGEAGAVLVRALEPGEGVCARLDGPGRLCRALGLDRRHNGLDLTADGSASLWIERRSGWPAESIATSRRIGVEYAGTWAEKPWRFFVPDSPHVSGRRLRS